jgi:hypothetical protein
VREICRIERIVEERVDAEAALVQGLTCWDHRRCVMQEKSYGRIEAKVANPPGL